VYDSGSGYGYSPEADRAAAGAEGIAAAGTPTVAGPLAADHNTDDLANYGLHNLSKTQEPSISMQFNGAE